MKNEQLQGHVASKSPITRGGGTVIAPNVFKLWSKPSNRQARYLKFK